MTKPPYGPTQPPGPKVTNPPPEIIKPSTGSPLTKRGKR